MDLVRGRHGNAHIPSMFRAFKSTWQIGLLFMCHLRLAAVLSKAAANGFMEAQQQNVAASDPWRQPQLLRTPLPASPALSANHQGSVRPAPNFQKLSSGRWECGSDSKPHTRACRGSPLARTTPAGWLESKQRQFSFSLAPVLPMLTYFRSQCLASSIDWSEAT